jgi:RsmE family RNA methyltransferase
MNIVLFEQEEWLKPLPAADGRAVHLVDILKLTPGDRFAAGEVGGRVGSLAFQGFQGSNLVFSHPEWTAEPPPFSRVRVLIGTPRPPTARRLMKDLTTLGVAELHFVATDLGDKSYLQSTLWDEEYRKYLKEGAAQTRSTLLPKVERHPSLRRAITATEGGTRVWFDEGGAPWDAHPAHAGAESGSLWLALGPERGWSAAERTLLADQGWSLAGLGSRVLRTETACALALGIAVLKGW